MNPWVSLLLGVLAAGFGGEAFVRGAVGLARWMKVPAGIIGATVAAFATSSPELSVAIQSAQRETPQIALGDALGSNVVNVALILGLALLMGPLHAERGALRRDFPVALGAPALLGLLVADGQLSRLDAGFLLVFFLVWLVMTAIDAYRQRDAAGETLGESVGWKAILFAVIGLALLIASGDLIVTGAKALGGALGWSPFVVGATLVALGTSMPELATTLISRMRGHDEVGLGTVLGSNIFNLFFIVSIAGLIMPIEVAAIDVLVGLGFGLLTLVATYPNRDGQVHRNRAWILLSLYAAYVVTLIQVGPSG